MFAISNFFWLGWLALFCSFFPPRPANGVKRKKKGNEWTKTPATQAVKTYLLLGKEKGRFGHMNTKAFLFCNLWRRYSRCKNPIWWRHRIAIFSGKWTFSPVVSVAWEIQLIFLNGHSKNLNGMGETLLCVHFRTFQLLFSDSTTVTIVEQ